MSKVTEAMSILRRLRRRSVQSVVVFLAALGLLLYGIDNERVVLLLDAAMQVVTFISELDPGIAD